MIDSNSNINGFPNAMKSDWIPGSARPGLNRHSAESAQPRVMSQKSGITGTFKDVNDIRQLSDISIKDLLSGKSEDIASMVLSMTRTDISFKAFAGIKNELIEAYRQTMNSSL